MTATGRRRSINSIQYLRGIAALAVLLSHALGHPLGQMTRNLLVTGRLGVLLFFVISGFIMVFVTGPDRFDAKSFLTKRIVRIVPFYWAVTLFTAGAALFAPSAFKATVVSARHLIASLLFIPAPNPAEPGAILPMVKLGWTLNCEMFFYVAFGCLAAFTAARRVALLALFFTLLVTIGQMERFDSAILTLYTNIVLIGFVAGIVIGLVFLNIDLARVTPAVVGLATVGCALLLAASFAFERGNVANYSVRMTVIMVLACALLIFIGLWLENTGKLIKSRLLHFVGDASYSIYLVHLFGVGLAVVLARKLGLPVTGLSYVAIVFGGIAFGLVVGCMAYIWIERPLTEQTRRILGRSSQPVPQ